MLGVESRIPARAKTRSLTTCRRPRVTDDTVHSARRGDRPRRSQAELARELHALLDALADAGTAERRYLMVRWRPQVLLAKRRVDSNRRWYYSWRVPTVVGALLLPPLASPTVEASWARWTALGVSLVVAICTALESTFRFGNRWRLYRRMLDELRSEGWAYAYRTGPYASKAEFTSFVERSEKRYADTERSTSPTYSSSAHLPNTRLYRRTKATPIPPTTDLACSCR